VLNELGGRMLAVLDKYGRDNGYAVILDVSSQQTPVLFAANGIDVTREIVDLYNKNAPAAPATSSAPPATPGATTAPAAQRPGTPLVKPPATATPRPATPKPAPAK